MDCSLINPDVTALYHLDHKHACLLFFITHLIAEAILSKASLSLLLLCFHIPRYLVKFNDALSLVFHPTLDTSPPPSAPFNHRIVSAKPNQIINFYTINWQEVLGG